MTAPLTLESVSQAIADPHFLFKCEDFHKGISCNEKALMMFLRVVKPVARTYIPIHILPVLLFKRKKFMKNPLKELFLLILGIVRSVLFGGGYYCSFKKLNCFMYKDCPLTPFTLKFFASFSGLPLLLETPNRQAEIALFTVYKTMQTVYNMARRRNLPIRIPAGSCVIPASALALICHHYFNNSTSIKESYRKAIDKLLQNS